MNAPVLLAQLAGSTTQTPPSPKNLKLEKPQNGQAVTVHLDGNTVDLSTEQTAFAENAVQYQTTLSFLNGRIGQITRALKGE